ncbi:hypothetical protein UFOVP55_76 [uncultured Caudovirales phage]|uniref:Uncharacterized protein n=1 Tax=uncultured Caudovirales phage TaxID=2100421 RepID=A0A6J5KW41_9CAUD|nr:hypothetical protein UFOVP55_76 [uncultured Caudovirales phage]
MALDFPASPTTNQTFTSGNQVWVYNGSAWASQYQSSGYVRQSFTASSGQTSFTVTGGYLASLVDVYQNGVKLVNGTDVTVTSGSTVNLAVGATTGDIIEVIGLSSFSLGGIYNQVGNSGPVVMRNRLINGGMAVDQRNAGAAQNITTTNTYCVDRWAVNAAATVTGTLTAQRVAVGSPGSSQYALRLARTTGTYVSALYALQVIETANCYEFAGKTVTVSFKARCGAAYSSTGTPINVYVRTGTAADEGVNGATAGTWTGYAQAGTQSFALTTTLQTFSLSVTLGSTAQEIAVMLGTGLFAGTGAANDYIEFTDVQLELGNYATAFERRINQQELAMCQRYYASGTTPISLNPTGSTANVSVPVTLPVPMRVAPTTYSATGLTIGAVSANCLSFYANTAGSTWTPVSTYIANAEL